MNIAYFFVVEFEFFVLNQTTSLGDLTPPLSLIDFENGRRANTDARKDRIDLT